MVAITILVISGIAVINIVIATFVATTIRVEGGNHIRHHRSRDLGTNPFRVLVLARARFHALCEVLWSLAFLPFVGRSCPALSGATTHCSSLAAVDRYGPLRGEEKNIAVCSTTSTIAIASMRATIARSVGSPSASSKAVSDPSTYTPKSASSPARDV